MTFKIIAGAAIFILIAGVYGILENREVSIPQPTNTPHAEEAYTLKDGESVAWLGVFHESDIQNNLRSFTSDELNISFTYPSDYLLFTNDAGAPEIRSITIGAEAALLEALKQSVPGEVPPSIGLVFYMEPTLAVSNIDHADYLMGWILEHPESSNFYPNDSTNEPQATTVGGTPAFKYHSSVGLYDSNEYVAFVHREWVVVASVYDSKNEKRGEVFESIIGSITRH